jgi:hypothetical protein
VRQSIATLEAVVQRKRRCQKGGQQGASIASSWGVGVERRRTCTLAKWLYRSGVGVGGACYRRRDEGSGVVALGIAEMSGEEVLASWKAVPL